MNTSMTGIWLGCEELLPVPCPDKIPGCAVAHFKTAKKDL